VYLENETQDVALWISTVLEGTVQGPRASWEATAREDAVWALMHGWEVRLYDAQGNVVTDTNRALAALPVSVGNRIMAVTGPRVTAPGRPSVSYALSSHGAIIARLEMTPLAGEDRGQIFLSRLNAFLLVYLTCFGGFAATLSVLFSRRLTKPLEMLSKAAGAISEGNLRSRVAVAGEDEIGRLSATFNRMAQSLETQKTLRRKLISNVAHELRTPIGAMRAELEGMLDGLIPLEPREPDLAPGGDRKAGNDPRGHRGPLPGRGELFHPQAPPGGA